MSTNSPKRLCGVRFTDQTMAELVAEAARQTTASGRSVSVAAVVRNAVGSYLTAVQRVANATVQPAEG